METKMDTYDSTRQPPSSRRHRPSSRSITRSRSRSPSYHDDDRKRSRSHRDRDNNPERKRKSHHHHSHSRRAHHSSRKHEDRPTDTKPAPPTAQQPLPFGSRQLTKRDLVHYEPVLGMYLDIQKNLELEDLGEDEIKGRWKSFIGKW